MRASKLAKQSSHRPRTFEWKSNLQVRRDELCRVPVTPGENGETAGEKDDDAHEQPGGRGVLFHQVSAGSPANSQKRKEERHRLSRSFIQSDEKIGTVEHCKSGSSE